MMASRTKLPAAREKALTLIVTGHILYDLGDGSKPQTHRQVTATRKYPREVTIWGRMFPSFPHDADWRIVGPTHDAGPQSVACRILNGAERMETDQAGHWMLRETHAITDFIVELENNEANHILQRVVEGYETFLTDERARQLARVAREAETARREEVWAAELKEARRVYRAEVRRIGQERAKWLKSIESEYL